MKKEAITISGKLKLIIVIFLIILFCISLYTIIIIKNKYDNGVELTQFAPQTFSQMMGYAIKTKNNKIIMIDGGMRGDSTQIKDYICNNGGEVEAWYITHAHQDHHGALIETLKNPQIKIKNIYASLYDLEFLKSNSPKNDYKEAKELYEALDSYYDQEAIHDVSVNQENYIDNIKIKILAVKNKNFNKNIGNNGSMVIKIYVNNKSILFLGDSGIEKGKWLLDNQKENLKSDIVQMAHHGQNGVSKDVYKQINPTVCLWPTPEWLWNNNDNHNVPGKGSYKTLETRKWMIMLGVRKNYIAKDGILTFKVW